MANTPWQIIFTDDAKKEFDLHFENHPNQTPYKKDFEQDVTLNPFYHPSYKRINKMKGKQYKDIYRWSKSNTRVIYKPVSENHTVYPLETSTATGISYKKKSKK